MSDIATEIMHVPVMADEVMSLIADLEPDLVVDATVGSGGHTERILTSLPKVRVIGMDQDQDAIDLAYQRLARLRDRFELVKANFSTVLSIFGTNKADAVIADLGVSSMQFDSETRGFSFRFDAPMDMRMDPDSRSETAWELLERLSEAEIAEVIFRYGEERFSRRIARRIVEARNVGKPIRTTRELADLVMKCVPYSRKDAIHPATRTFQAIRIAVNHELDVLGQFIDDSIDVLKPHGILAIITFHSLEDRIVKTGFQKSAGKCFCPPKIPKCVCGAQKRVEILTKKPLVPSEIEITRNPRARSAKLRAVRKLDQ